VPTQIVLLLIVKEHLLPKQRASLEAA